MKIARLSVGMLQTNCYILSSDRKNAMLIDPGAEPERILAYCRKEGLAIRMLVFTHGHFDHIGAASALKEATGAQTVLPAADEELFLDPKKNGGFFTSFAGYTPQTPDRLYGEGEVIELDEIRLTAMHTPGHTKGSSILVGEGVLFTGDTLFAGSAGRTDLYGGNSRELMASLNRIAMLEGDFLLLSGHGEQSTLAREKTTNPFLGTNYDNIF